MNGLNMEVVSSQPQQNNNNKVPSSPQQVNNSSGDLNGIHDSNSNSNSAPLSSSLMNMNNGPKMGGAAADDLESRLIEAVRRHPSLYNPSHEHYGNRQANAQHRSAVWQEIAKELEFEGDPSELQSRWKRVRDRYTRERRKRKAVGTLGDMIAQTQSAGLYQRMGWIDQYISVGDNNNGGTPYFSQQPGGGVGSNRRASANNSHQGGGNGPLNNSNDSPSSTSSELSLGSAGLFPSEQQQHFSRGGSGGVGFVPIQNQQQQTYPHPIMSPKRKRQSLGGQQRAQSLLRGVNNGDGTPTMAIDGQTLIIERDRILVNNQQRPAPLHLQQQHQYQQQHQSQMLVPQPPAHGGSVRLLAPANSNNASMRGPHPNSNGNSNTRIQHQPSSSSMREQAQQQIGMTHPQQHYVLAPPGSAQILQDGRLHIQQQQQQPTHPHHLQQQLHPQHQLHHAQVIHHQYEPEASLIETIVHHLATLNDDEKVVTKMFIQRILMEARFGTGSADGGVRVVRDDEEEGAGDFSVPQPQRHMQQAHNQSRR